MKKRFLAAMLCLCVLLAGCVGATEEQVILDGKTVEIPDRDNVRIIRSNGLREAINTELGKPASYQPTVKDLEKLKELDASMCNVRSLEGLQYCTSLEELALSMNRVSNLEPLRELTRLTHLDLYDNQVVDLAPISGLSNLESLDLYENRISDLSPLAGLSKLQDLDLGENQIKDLSGLEGLTTLVILDLSYNEIRDLSLLSGISSLEELVLTGNYGIRDLSPLKKMENLQKLTVRSTGSVKLSDIAGLTNLTSIDISYGYLDDLTLLNDMANLEELSLRSCGIEDLTQLDQQLLERLTALNISGNKIDDITPLTVAKNMQRLDLSDNLLTDVSPLLELPNLERVSIADNYIHDLSILGQLFWPGGLETVDRQDPTWELMGHIDDFYYYTAYIIGEETGEEGVLRVPVPLGVFGSPVELTPSYYNDFELRVEDGYILLDEPSSYYYSSSISFEDPDTGMTGVFRVLTQEYNWRY